MAGPVLSEPQIIALWLNEGGTLSSAAEAVARARAESGGSTTITSANPDGGTNVGLFQLDTDGVSAGHSVTALQDPYTNARITVQATQNGQNWEDWSDNWGEFSAAAQQAVTAYKSAAGTGRAATAYRKSLLTGITGAGSAGVPASGSGSTAQGQSLAGQAGDAVSQAGDLLHGTAETLNWFWQWFEPGQGWRLAFGAGAVVLAYAGLRQWGLVPPLAGAASAAGA